MRLHHCRKNNRPYRRVSRRKVERDRTMNEVESLIGNSLFWTIMGGILCALGWIIKTTYNYAKNSAEQKTRMIKIEKATEQVQTFADILREHSEHIKLLENGHEEANIRITKQTEDFTKKIEEHENQYWHNFTLLSEENKQNIKDISALKKDFDSQGKLLNMQLTNIQTDLAEVLTEIKQIAEKLNNTKNDVTRIDARVEAIEQKPRVRKEK